MFPSQPVSNDEHHPASTRQVVIVGGANALPQTSVVVAACRKTEGG